MLKKILIAIAVLIAAVLVVAATKPDTFQVQRNIAINAPPEAVLPYLQDFHKWGAWSPWEKLDPAMRRTFAGADAGKGAVYEWSGNSDVGRGRMEITDVSRSQVAIKLDFLEPFESHNVTTFTLVLQAGGTEVKWVMDGPNPYISKLMQVFVNMDKMIGKDFDAGLSELKKAAESGAAK
jgi:hypothetical protein